MKSIGKYVSEGNETGTVNGPIILETNNKETN